MSHLYCHQREIGHLKSCGDIRPSYLGLGCHRGPLHILVFQQELFEVNLCFFSPVKKNGGVSSRSYRKRSREDLENTADSF